MIPQEIKEKIMALYWGQSVVILLDDKKKQKCDVLGGTLHEIQFNRRKAYLLLRSLSDITDEHVIEVCIYNGDMRPVNISDVDSEDIQLAKEDILSGFDGSQNGCIDLRNVVHIIDFLRSKSYALPAHGYSVEQLIEERVFKIKQT